MAMNVDGRNFYAFKNSKLALCLIACPHSLPFQLALNQSYG